MPQNNGTERRSRTFVVVVVVVVVVGGGGGGVCVCEKIIFGGCYVFLIFFRGGVGSGYLSVAKFTSLLLPLPLSLPWPPSFT